RSMCRPSYSQYIFYETKSRGPCQHGHALKRFSFFIFTPNIFYGTAGMFLLNRSTAISTLRKLAGSTLATSRACNLDIALSLIVLVLIILFPAIATRRRHCSAKPAIPRQGPARVSGQARRNAAPLQPREQHEARQARRGAHHITDLLAGTQVKVTRLAYGV